MRIPKLVLAIVLCLVLPTRDARASSILDFDNLPTFGVGAPVPNGYGGLNWSFFGVVDETINPPARWVSAPNYVYAYCCQPQFVDEISISSGTFDLLSGHFAVLGGIGLPADVSDSYVLRGYLGAIELYTQTLTATTTPTFIALNMSGVDRVRVDNVTNFLNLAIDNLEVNVPAAAAVPEPTSLLLFGSGILGVLAKTRRRKRLM